MYIPWMTILIYIFINVHLCNNIFEEENITERLSRYIKPIEYRISFVVYLNEVSDEKQFTFQGKEEIRIEVIKPTNQINLNCENLNITKIHVKGVEILEENGDCLNNPFYNLTLSKFLEINETYNISLEFSGKLNNETEGFFLTSYNDNNGNKKYLAATQFEYSHARKAFPCFDEPDLKATFELDFKFRQDYNAISNMPQFSNSSSNDGMKYIKFEKSIKMSTYLVAFFISDFKPCEFNNYLPITIWSQDKFKQYSKYSANKTEHLMKEMEEFCNQSYQLKKLDQVAVPNFNICGMENWGLIYYKEATFFNQPTKMTTEEKQHVVDTISHEISHQWFGNQVTPEKWDHLWLSEGFATYFEFYLIDQIEPDWRSEEQFVIKEMYPFFIKEFNNPQTLINNDSSDTIFASYKKGGSIIRMLKNVLSPEIFKLGLRNYLTERNQSTSTPFHLWKSFQNAYDKLKGQQLGKMTVQQFGTPWITQPGYPIVNVEVDKVNRKIHFSQEQFSNKRNDANSNIWPIPINLVTKSNMDFENTTPTIWLLEKNLSIDLPEDSFVIINIQQTGYYRTIYNDKNWMDIANYLFNNFENVYPLTRGQLLYDALYFANEDKLNYSIVFSLLKYLQNETDYIPWKCIKELLERLIWNLSNIDKNKDYVNFQIKLIEKVYNEINGFEINENESNIETLKRKLITELACKLGYQPCRKSAIEKFKYYVKTNKLNKISPDFKYIIYCNGLRSANEKEWTSVYNLLQDVEFKKEIIVSALGCSENKHILEKYFDMIIEMDENKFISKSTGFASVYTSGSFGLNFTINYLIEHKVIKISNLDKRKILSGIANLVVTNDQKVEFVKIPHVNEFDIEKIDKNIEWYNKYQQDISNWFKKDESRETARNSTPLFYLLVLMLITIFLYNESCL